MPKLIKMEIFRVLFCTETFWPLDGDILHIKKNLSLFLSMHDKRTERDLKVTVCLADTFARSEH